MVKAKQKPKQLPTTPGCGRRFSKDDPMWWTYTGRLSTESIWDRRTNHWMEYDNNKHSSFTCGKYIGEIYNAPQICLDCARKMGVEW